MPRHHIIPQMILERFANPRRQVVLHPRNSDSPPVVLAIRKACSEVGFCEIPVEDIAEDHQNDHNPELVENILSDIEGTANSLLNDVVAGRFPLSAQERFKLCLFLAIQMSRGWAFRESMNQVSQNILELAASVKFPGIPAEDLPRAVATKSFAIQSGLDAASNTLMPHLYFRTWRLLKFDEPCLLTSDSPFGYWAPPEMNGAGPFGVGNAPLVFFPLDRKTALAMSRTDGRELVVRSGATRAKQINYTVAIEAERWIVHHPDDAPLEGLLLPPPSRFVHEHVSETVGPDGELRQLFQLIRR